MNEDRFYIKDLEQIRSFCQNSDKEDIYKYIYSLQQENNRLKEQIEEIMKFKIDRQLERIEKVENE